MIAGESTPAGDPGDPAFTHPSSGKNLKPWCGHILGRARALPGCDQPPHDLTAPVQMLFGPCTQCPSVMALSPEELHAGTIWRD